MTFNSIPQPMASSRSRSNSVSSDSSLDEDYFFRTYVPLSNLPTPPLTFSSNDSSYQLSPDLFPQDEYLDPKLLGPAIHLTNLIPSSTTLTIPCVPLVHAIVTRAALPLETIALAVCILDSLNSRFALAWRQSFPLSPSGSQNLFEKSHIDSTHPEIIVLSALILAVKFVDDEPEKTIAYAEDMGKEMWTCDQINYTQRLILENLSYRLLPLWEESIISEAMEHMERARRQSERQAEKKMKLGTEMPLYPAEPSIWDDDWDSETFCGSFEGEGMSDGKAVIGLGQQLTPALTPVGMPMAENIGGTRDVAPETRKAFEETGVACKREDNFVLPDRTLETFPRYVEPVMEGMGLGF
ncbi:hypothetical protein D0Z07_4375 [Hyphodiscus hymeniophilus]|uniref:Cyclin N-terminal domain-containing protein n=1 Tax=Hyphodiscus hymeniophilus TaxID=353542 RepID=A0A9P7AXF1_9HELO|nr:hypothetical protein D0Z07_4375 [Hyphodiscus hymeniophilus]